jgi:quinol-cytochrome oxidoreductase complex cytochrome b subunit
MIAVHLLILLSTGVWLAAYYRPVPPGTRNQPSLYSLHSLSGRMVIIFALFALVLIAIDRLRRLAVASAVGLFVVLLALAFTGYLLPWDQLALFAVRTGTDIRGFVDPMFRESVRFAIVDGVEVSRATWGRWFMIHTIVLPLPAAAAFAFTARQTWRREQAKSEQPRDHQDQQQQQPAPPAPR